MSNEQGNNDTNLDKETPEDNTASASITIADDSPTPDTSEAAQEVSDGKQIVAFVNKKIEYFTEVLNGQDARISDLAHRQTAFMRQVENVFDNFETKLATQIAMAVDNAFTKHSGEKPQLVTTSTDEKPKPTLISNINLKELFKPDGTIDYARALKMLSGEINIDAKSVKELVDNFGDVIRGIMNLWDEIAVRLGIAQPSVDSGIIPNSQGFTQRDLQLLKYVTESMLKKSTQETINRIKREWKIDIPTDMIIGTMLDNAPKLIRTR